MHPRQRPESEYVEIGIPWLAAALLCVVGLPFADDLRSLMGPVVLSVYGMAVLMAICFAICKTVSRKRTHEANMPHEIPAAIK
jgi:hypothetical protein